MPLNGKSGQTSTKQIFEMIKRAPVSTAPFFLRLVSAKNRVCKAIGVNTQKQEITKYGA